MMSGERMKLIIDCDPGHDDATALLLLGSTDLFEVLGVCTVSGNQTIEKTTKNALNVLAWLGLPYKVYAGADRPLYKERVNCPEIHGESGLDGFDFPRYDRRPEALPAADFMIGALKRSDEKVVIVTTGPMTNLASALTRAPEIKEKIEKIVLMGGSIGAGNVTPAAEFNIYCDPEAAEICFTAGLPVYMIGLDVTRRVLVTPEIVDRMAGIGNRASEMFAALMRAYNANQKKVFGLDGGPLHDPVTVACLMDENLVHFEHVNTEIDVSGGCSWGRTNCDIPGFLGKEKNSFVATDIDEKRFWEIVETAIRHYDRCKGATVSFLSFRRQIRSSAVRCL